MSASSSRTRARASRPRSSIASSTASSKATPPTPARSAAPAWAWPSAAASSSSTAAASGPKARPARAAASSSRCPPRFPRVKKSRRLVAWKPGCPQRACVRKSCGASARMISEKVNDGRKCQKQAQAQQRESNCADTARGDCPFPPTPFQNPPGEKPDENGSRGYAGERTRRLIEHKAARDESRLIAGEGQYCQRSEERRVGKEGRSR